MTWIKIYCGLLDDIKIKMLKKGAEGNTLVLLWILLIIEAGKCDKGGYLMISSTMPYDPESISLITDISLDTVRLGLSRFEHLGMIDQQDGVLCITNWAKYQSEDKLEARRKKDRERKQRQRQRHKENLKMLPDPVTSQDTTRDVTPKTRPDKTKPNQTRSDQTANQSPIIDEYSDIEDYLRLGGEYGGRGDNPPKNPTGWQKKVSRRINEQGGCLDNQDMEQLARWRQLKAAGMDNEQAKMKELTEEQLLDEQIAALSERLLDGDRNAIDYTLNQRIIGITSPLQIKRVHLLVLQEFDSCDR